MILIKEMILTERSKLLPLLMEDFLRIKSKRTNITANVVGYPHKITVMVFVGRTQLYFTVKAQLD